MTEYSSRQTPDKKSVVMVQIWLRVGFITKKPPPANWPEGVYRVPNRLLAASYSLTIQRDLLPFPVREYISIWQQIVTDQCRVNVIRGLRFCVIVGKVR